MPRNLDVASLRAFVTVAECCNITSAARTLNLTQGAVSQQVGRLEQCLETELFTRMHRGVRLTTAGERFLSMARDVVASNDLMWTAAAAADARQPLRFGAPPDIVHHVLPPVLARVAAERPEIDLSILAEPSTELAQALRDGRIDLALIQQPGDDPSGQVLAIEPICWVGAMGGTAWRHDPKPLSIVHLACCFRRAMIDALDGKAQQWRPVLDAAGYDNTIAALRADIAISAFQRSMVGPGLEIISGDDLPALPDFAVSLHRSGHARLPAADAFATILVEEVSTRWSMTAPSPIDRRHAPSPGMIVDGRHDPEDPQAIDAVISVDEHRRWAEA